MTSAAVEICLNHDSHQAHGGHQFVALRKIATLDLGARLELRDDEAVCFDSLFQAQVLLGVAVVYRRTQHCNSFAPQFERGGMSNRVDSLGEPAHNAESSVHQEFGNLACPQFTLWRGVSLSNDRN